MDPLKSTVVSATSHPWKNSSNKELDIFQSLMIRKTNGEIFRVCFPGSFWDIGLKVKICPKTTKFITFPLIFGSKMWFLRVNIFKTAWKTYPQNLTMIFTHLKWLKNGVIVIGGVFYLHYGERFTKKLSFEVNYYKARVFEYSDCKNILKTRQNY